MSKAKKIGGIVLIVIGTVFLVLGLLFGALFIAMGGAMKAAPETFQEEVEKFRSHALETIGEITDVDEEEGVTTIEYYSDVDDSYYEITVTAFSSEFQIGDTILVYYDIDDPSVFMVPDLVEMIAGKLDGIFIGVGAVVGGIFIAIGLILLVVGIVLVVQKKKDGQEGAIVYQAPVNPQNGQ